MCDDRNLTSSTFFIYTYMFIDDARKKYKTIYKTEYENEAK